MAFGDRKSTAPSAKEAPRAGGFKSKSQTKQGPAEWINLGSITAVKGLLEKDDLYGEICEALDGSEFSFNLKIYTGDNDKTIELRNGDFVTLKFKKGPKDPDFVLGKASLKVGE